MSKAKRITDKERLDFMSDGKREATWSYISKKWCVPDGWTFHEKSNLRATIDAAIRASRKKGGQ